MVKKLISKTAAKKIPALYAQENVKDPIVYAHIFSCVANYDFYCTEYDPENLLAFGYVKFFENEWGYVSIAELEQVNANKGFGVFEFDRYFTPAPISTFKN